MTTDKNLLKTSRPVASRPRLSTVILVLAVLALVVCNIMTLALDTWHASGFKLLESIASSALPEPVVSKLFSRSSSRLALMRQQVASKVSTRVARRAVLNAGKNVSSVAAEIVPFFGVAIILGLTASDLYDDCQTLKDMNELSLVYGEQHHDDATVCGMKVPFIDK